MEQKKRHHYVPVTYLNGFTDEQGTLFARRKDKPEILLHSKPDGIAFERYYYSQPLENGEKDNNTLEDFFSNQVEGYWNMMMAVIRNQQPLTADVIGHLMDFIVLQRVRVPFLRDAIELLHAEQVKLTYHFIQKRGKFDSIPLQGESLSVDELEVSIDPHTSLLAMGTLSSGCYKLLNMLGFWILKNETDVPFITSDNPVIYYDPNPLNDECRPYTIDRNAPRIQFFFPLDSWHLLGGHTDFRNEYMQYGIPYLQQSENLAIAAMNELIAQFSYAIVFSKEDNIQNLVKKYAEYSPIAEFSRVQMQNGDALIANFVFGKRPKKQKWQSQKS